MKMTKMYKGGSIVAHNAISATSTSAAIDCTGYNSVIIHRVSSLTDKTWTIQVLGSPTAAGTFVPWITQAGLDLTYMTDISGFFLVEGVPDFIKLLCTEVYNGATVSCIVQPLNL